MNFISTLKNNEAIQEAFRRIPKELHWRLHADWFLGGCPNRAGLHAFVTSSVHGIAYNKLAHVCYPHHQICAERNTTVVLPEADYEITPHVVIHELGHVLDAQVGFSVRCVPCTQYAQTNREEAFAEAFTAWASPEYLWWGGRPVERDRAFFDNLCRLRQP